MRATYYGRTYCARLVLSMTALPVKVLVELVAVCGGSHEVSPLPSSQWPCSTC